MEADFGKKLRGGERLVGTFLKTPSHIALEILILGGLDFVVLDAEHAPFDRAAIDACMAVARAQSFPLLVRVCGATPADVLSVLDMGATGLVVPHVDSVEKAQALAKSAHFGRGGRGYAGSTRWAGYTKQTMPDLLARSAETVVIAQIEEPEGVDACEAIAAVPGIDALFTGPADLSVSYGHNSVDNPDLAAAMARVGDACRAAGKGYATWVPNAAVAADWRKHGFNAFVVASEHSWIMQGAQSATDQIKALT